jgi:hypothetical protein
MRDAIPQHEINAIAEFIAGGASLDAIQERWNDVAESWFVANWDSLLAQAARTRPARLPTEEEIAAAQIEGQRLDALFAHRRRLPSAEAITGHAAKRALGR